MYKELTRSQATASWSAPRPRKSGSTISLELGWQLYLCSSPPYLLQIGERIGGCAIHTDLALRRPDAEAACGARQPQSGAGGAAWTRPPEKPHAHQKYWRELLEQVGGRVRARHCSS